jgi:hypothetical protein
MQQDTGRHDFGIMGRLLKLPEALREQPRSNDVIEQVWLARPTGIGDCLIDQRRVRHGNTCEDPGGDRQHGAPTFR